MNDTNKLLSKLAAKLDDEEAHEEAEEVRKLFEDEKDKLETKETKIEAECPSCGCHMTGTMIESLTDMADKLDEAGAHKEADVIDGMIRKFAEDVQWKKEDSNTQQSHRYDSDYNNKQTFRRNKVEKKPETKHHNPSSQEVGDKVLSMRYCPDHIGVMLHRVGEGSYRCELDGKVYNWEAGWTDANGKHYGGSISGQTESTTNVPIPSRVFDPREDVINKIH